MILSKERQERWQLLPKETPEIPVFASHISDELLGTEGHDIFKQIALQRLFYADRPVLLKHNNQVEKSIKLLVDEIMELNGHAEDGMSLEDYRAQECVDIWNYSLTVMMALGHTPNTTRLDSIIESIGVTKVNHSSEVPSPEYPEKYERIKKAMVSTANDFYGIEGNGQLQSRHSIIQTAERLWAYTAAALYTLGRNPMEEFREKVARNMVKYIPTEEAWDLSEKGYAKYTKKCKELFKHEGERPNGGNRYFYERQRQQISPEVLQSYVEIAQHNPPLTTMLAIAELGMTEKEYRRLPLDSRAILNHVDQGLPLGSVKGMTVWRPQMYRKIENIAVMPVKALGQQMRAYLR